MRLHLSKSILVVSWFLSLFSSGIFADGIKPQKVDVNIGVYAPFSNEHGFIGRTILGTIESARDQLATQHINYTIYTLDQLPNNPNEAQTIQKFIDAHQIQVLLTNGTASGFVAAPIARKNNIIHFSMANEPKIADGKNNFLAWNMDYEQAMVVVEQLKMRNVIRSTHTHIDPHSKAALNHSMVKQLQAKSPVSNAFQLIHQSATLAMKNNADCSGKHLSEQIHVLALAQGIDGAFNVGKSNGQVARNSLPIYVVNKAVG